MVLMIIINYLLRGNVKNKYYITLEIYKNIEW